MTEASLWFKASHAVGAREAAKLSQEEKVRAAHEHLHKVNITEMEDRQHKKKSHDGHKDDHDEVRGPM